jgi:hypothetical protein
MKELRPPLIAQAAGEVAFDDQADRQQRIVVLEITWAS